MIYQGQFTWELLEKFPTEFVKETAKKHKTVWYIFYKENDKYQKEKNNGELCIRFYTRCEYYLAYT